MNMRTLQLIQEHIPQDISVGSEYTESEADKLEEHADVNNFEQTQKIKKEIGDKLAVKLKQQLKGGFKEKEKPKQLQHSPHVCKEAEPLPKHVCEKAPPPPPRSMMLSSSVQTDKKEMISQHV